MSRFFDTGVDGWINLDHVRHIRQIHRKGEQTLTIFTLKENGMFETSRRFNPSDYSADIIPAAPGTYYLSVYCHDGVDGKGRPTVCETTVEPVIAWVIPIDTTEFRWPDPIFLESPASNVTTFYPQTDGKYRAVGDCTYNSIEELKQETLEQAQRDWDKEASAVIGVRT